MANGDRLSGDRTRLVRTLEGIGRKSCPVSEFLDLDFSASADRAVKETWLILFDLLVLDDLHGTRREISPDEEKIVARCVLFLRSETEYEWPDYPDRVRNNRIILLALIMAFVLTIFSFYWFAYPTSGVLLMAIVAVAALIVVSAFLQNKRACDAWSSTGDERAWPFLTASELEKVKMELPA